MIMYHEEAYACVICKFLIYVAPNPSVLKMELQTLDESLLHCRGC